MEDGKRRGWCCTRGESEEDEQQGDHPPFPNSWLKRRKTRRATTQSEPLPLSLQPRHKQCHHHSQPWLNALYQLPLPYHHQLAAQPSTWQHSPPLSLPLPLHQHQHHQQQDHQNYPSTVPQVKPTWSGTGLPDLSEEQQLHQLRFQEDQRSSTRGKRKQPEQK